MTPAPAATLQSYAGACHCGACGFTFETQLPLLQWTVRECQCGFCRAHAVATVSDRRGRLEFVEREAGTLQRYRFGMRTADFLLCRRCGVYLGAVIETPRGHFGIANVRALAMPDLVLPAGQAVDYDNENTAQRITRREERWTPVPRAVSAR